MKNSLLLFVLFICNFHFSQQLIYNKDTVGFISSINANYAELSYDITLTTSLTKYELNKVKSTYNLKIDKVIYDFKLPSDYLKQSSIFRERAIKTRVTTSLVGFGLGVIGGVIASRPSQTIVNRNIGFAFVGAGSAISFGGLLFTIKLNLSANDMLRRGAQEYRNRGL
jgi:hypothetical protein